MKFRKQAKNKQPVKAKKIPRKPLKTSDISLVSRDIGNTATHFGAKQRDDREVLFSIDRHDDRNSMCLKQFVVMH